MLAQFLLFALAISASTQYALAACQFNHGDYKLQWSVDSSDRIHFTLTYRKYPASLNSWTGVAFGEGMMYGLDAVLVRNVNGKISVTDDNVMGYGPANTDASQDIKVESAKVQNGNLQVKFSRAANTKDNQADIPLSGCKTWQFITSINPAFGTHTSKHVQTPIAQKVCLDKCRA